MSQELKPVGYSIALSVAPERTGFGAVASNDHSEIGSSAPFPQGDCNIDQQQWPLDSIQPACEQDAPLGIGRPRLRLNKSTEVNTVADEADIGARSSNPVKPGPSG